MIRANLHPRVCLTLLASIAISAAIVAACAPVGGSVNPFMTLTETFGVTAGTNNDNTGGTGGGQAAATVFRRTMTMTFANNVAGADLNTRFIAWVNASSIRSADQQDALLSSNYVQLSREIDIGLPFQLPPGTFVYNGPGVAGATTVFLKSATADEQNNVTATTLDITLITPDVFLVAQDPPFSCESVAFAYTVNGDPIPTPFQGGGAVAPFAGANGLAGTKTLAQVDVYRCDPFRPGLFLRNGGGVANTNEYLEGQNVRIDFFLAPDAQNHAAIVTIQN
jgi:hypothetical protein